MLRQQHKDTLRDFRIYIFFIFSLDFPSPTFSLLPSSFSVGNAFLLSCAVLVAILTELLPKKKANVYQPTRVSLGNVPTGKLNMFVCTSQEKRGIGSIGLDKRTQRTIYVMIIPRAAPWLLTPLVHKSLVGWLMVGLEGTHVTIRDSQSGHPLCLLVFLFLLALLLPSVWNSISPPFSFLFLLSSSHQSTFYPNPCFFRLSTFKSCRNVGR